MSLATKLRCVMHTKISRHQALETWREIVRIAVNQNNYEQSLKDRINLSLDNGDYAGLLRVSESIVHTAYAQTEDHFLAHQLSNLIRKYPDLPGLDTDPRKAAERTFESAEWRCKWGNRKLVAIRSRDTQPFVTERMEAQKYIRYVLTDRSQRDPEGPVCDFPYAELWESCDFTGGASLGVNGSSTHYLAKLMQGEGDKWTVGSRAFGYAARAMWENSHIREWVLTADKAESPHYCVDEREFANRFTKMVRIVSYNKVGFVPKTAMTMRSIAVEPTLNTFLLKGVDQIFRRRLKRVGLDLSNQEQNKRMAWLGSLEWESDDPYCTIDLSSASDTISIMCVRDLLPEEWFTVLDDLRSRYRESGKGVQLYEKFVTMGNGFCFPLQTLIYASFCVAASAAVGVKPDFRVYGDDIVVRKSVFSKVMELLEFYGFVTNKRKTFSEGPFRESCGGDYHQGTNVRPIVFDTPLEQLQQVFGFYNQTLRSPCPYVKDYFKDVREYLFSKVDDSVRYVSDSDPAVTDVNGDTIDGAFWVCQDIALGSPFTRWNRYTQSLSYVRLQAKPVVDKRARSTASSNQWGLAYLMAALRGGSSATPFTLRYQTNYIPRIVNPEKDYGVCSPKRVRRSASGLTLMEP